MSHLQVTEVSIPKPPLNLEVTPISLDPVEITANTVNGNTVYEMDRVNFLADLQNNLKLLQLIDEQRRIINAYKEYYEPRK